MEKRQRSAGELEGELRVRLGGEKYRLVVQRSPAVGWHATVHSCGRDDLHRLQAQADKVALELAQHYELAED